jgi:hypothetical protein
MRLEFINLKWESTAPVEVRKCCDKYDQRYGCTILKKCVAPKCKYYQEVVLKVAVQEAALTVHRAEKTKTGIRLCPDCDLAPLKPKERFCLKYRIVRRKSGIRINNARRQRR